MPATDAPTAAPQSMPPPASPRRCENCGAPLYGEHCHACGQPTKGLVRHFSSVLGDFFDTVFNIDSRVLRTLWPLADPAGLPFAGIFRRSAGALCHPDAPVPVPEPARVLRDPGQHRHERPARRRGSHLRQRGDRQGDDGGGGENHQRRRVAAAGAGAQGSGECARRRGRHRHRPGQDQATRRGTDRLLECRRCRQGRGQTFAEGSRERRRQAEFPDQGQELGSGDQSGGVRMAAGVR